MENDCMFDEERFVALFVFAFWTNISFEILERIDNPRIFHCSKSSCVWFERFSETDSNDLESHLENRQRTPTARLILIEMYEMRILFIFHGYNGIDG